MQQAENPIRRWLEKTTKLNPEARAQMEAAIERIEERKRQGLPPMAGLQVCGICNGAGVLQSRRYDPTQEPPPPLIPCYACQGGHEQLRYEAGLRLNASGMASYATWTFAATTPTPAQTEAYDRAREWAQAKMPGALDDQPFLWLTGPFHTGKSRLAACVANLWLERGDEVMFRLETSLYDDLRATFDAESQTTLGMEFGRLQRVPYLVLDDMGKAKESEFVLEKRFTLCDYRLTRGLPTVITTNIPLDELDDKLPRLAPRILREDRAEAFIIPMQDVYR